MPVSETRSRTAGCPEVPPDDLEIGNQLGLQSDLTAIGKLDGIIEKVQQNLFNTALIADGLAKPRHDIAHEGQDLSFQPAVLRCLRPC